ncbi:hypothetical protein WAI453_004301 [Rhynchosporium graminicola]
MNMVDLARLGGHSGRPIIDPWSLASRSRQRHACSHQDARLYEQPSASTTTSLITHRLDTRAFKRIDIEPHWLSKDGHLSHKFNDDILFPWGGVLLALGLFFYRASSASTMMESGSSDMTVICKGTDEKQQQSGCCTAPDITVEPIGKEDGLLRLEKKLGSHVDGGGLAELSAGGQF